MFSLKKQIKKLIPLKARIIFNFFKDFNSNPYYLGSLLSPKESISDFFIFDKDCNDIGFIAENIRAILLCKEVEVTHNFMFFSQDGKFIEKQSYKTKDFFKKIIFHKVPSKDKYFSFIHYVESEIKLIDILKNIKEDFHQRISEQNRGYSIYYPSAKGIGSVVHGNFGGITRNLIPTARKTLFNHIYTPIYKFEANSKYDVVFNNPTKKNIFVKIIFNDLFKNKIINIPSFGTRYLSINEYSGSISFESKLPICRALVFKNPTPNLSGSFDVFHS